MALFTQTATAERLLASLAPTGSSLSRSVAGGTAWVVRAGVEVRSTAALDVSVPWSLPAAESGATGRAAAGGASLVLRAAGDVRVAGSVSSGFEAPFGDASADPRSWTPVAGSAGSIRMVAGADTSAADVAATLRPVAGAAPGKLSIGSAEAGSTPVIVRSTSGRIGLHAQGDVVLAGSQSTVYTTGVPVTTLPADAPLLDFSALTFEFVPALNDQGYISPYLQGGGEVVLQAGGSVRGAAPDPVTPYLATDWWWRGANAPSALWWSRYDRFAGGVATFGGGDVLVRAGQDVVDLNTATATSGWMPLAGGPAGQSSRTYGGGTLQVSAGRDLLGGSLFAGGQRLNADAGGRFGAAVDDGTGGTGNINTPLAPELIYQNTTLDLQARGDLTLSRLRSAGLTAPSLANVSGALVLGGLDGTASLQMTSSAGSVASLSLGQINSSAELRDGFWSALGSSLPGSVQVAAPQGSVALGGSPQQQPGSVGRLQVLAAADVRLANLAVYAGGLAPAPVADSAAAVIEQRATGVFAVNNAGSQQLDASAREVVQLAARDGDVVLAGSLQSARPVRINAGRDIAFEGQGQLTVQHQPARLDGAAAQPISELSLLQAGRDIRAGSAEGITIAGPGDLVLMAGRDIDLAASGGVNAIGNQRNGTLLPEGGAQLSLAAGLRLDNAVGADLQAAIASGYAVTGAVGLIDRPAALYAWLKDGDTTLDNPTALAFAALSAAQQQRDVATLLAARYPQALARYLRTTLALGMTPTKAAATTAAQAPALLADPATAADVQRVQATPPAEQPAVALALLREPRVRQRVELAVYLRAVLAQHIDAGNAEATLASLTEPLRQRAVGALLADAFAQQPAAQRSSYVASQAAQLNASHDQRLAAWLQPVLGGPLASDAAYLARVAGRLALPASTPAAAVLTALTALPADQQLAALDATDQAGWRQQPDQQLRNNAVGLVAYLARTTQLTATPETAAAALALLPRERQLPWLAQVLRADLQSAGTTSAATSGETFDAANALGYLSLDALFPLAQRGDGGRADAGNIVMPTSRVRTSQAAGITLLAPTGGINAGEVVPGAVAKTPSELGVVTVSGGDIFAAVRDNFEVNQSRVFTLARGDILLWSSDGNVDAGRGAKTVSGAPAPVLRLDANGNLVLDTSGSFSGSGIATLDAGSAVALFAPRGEVNAGEAGISAAGNITIAAARVVGADNIAVGGGYEGTRAEAPVAGATAGLSSLGQSATTAAQSAAASNDDDPRKKRKRRNVLLDFLGFGSGD